MTALQPSPRGHAKPLSPREQMVLALIAEGLTNAEIAASLNIGRSTVKRRVSSIMWKLDVHTRRDAVREASKRAEGSDPISETQIRLTSVG
jgi:DNA-binding NarL/FixJ family response regulator